MSLENQPTPAASPNRGTCGTCRFGNFVLTSGNPQLACKFNPPIVTAAPLIVNKGNEQVVQWITHGTGWAVVDKDDWCGQWQQDPIARAARNVVENSSVITS